MCCPSPSAHLLRSSQRAAPFPHRKGPRCNNTGDEDESGVETAHGCIFVAVFDYLQSERLKHGYKILTSWREAGFLLTSGSFPPSSSPCPSSSSSSSSSTTQLSVAVAGQLSFRTGQICGGLGGDPRGRPLGANPSTRPSGQPARRARVAAPASGHGGRLCGIEEPGEVLLASSRRPGGSWSELGAPI